MCCRTRLAGSSTYKGKCDSPPPRSSLLFQYNVGGTLARPYLLRKRSSPHYTRGDMGSLRPVSTLARLARHLNRKKISPNVIDKPSSIGRLPSGNRATKCGPVPAPCRGILFTPSTYLDWGLGIDKRPGFAVKGWVALGLNLELAKSGVREQRGLTSGQCL